VKDVDKIIEKLKTLKPQLEKEYFVEEIGVFGSYVRDEQTENSDIDILINFKDGMDLLKLAHLINWLCDVFEKKVDVVNKKTLRPRIGKQILSEVIYI